MSWRLTSLGWCGWVAAWIVTWTIPATAQVPRPQPKVMSWQPPATGQSAAFGILGEVARPGVYMAPNSTATLQELLRQSGGITARGSSAVRIVRQSRTAQAVFFSPTGHDPLLPNDVVVVDELRDRRPAAENAAPMAPPGVWVCFVGVADRPVIVPLRPEEAQFTTVMRMLGQSEKLAQFVKMALPPRSPWPASADELIPSGAVLTFDRGLLVTQNLPASFPDAVPFATPNAAAPHTGIVAAEPSQAVAPPISIAPPPPTLSADSEISAALASQTRTAVEAIPVPFPSPPSEPTSVSTASLPAPGSPLQQLIAPAPPQDVPSSRPKVDPRHAADKSVEIFPAAELDDADVAINVAAPPGFSIWQMLGIGGTVASLIGIAFATRKYLDRSEPPPRWSLGSRIAVTSPASPLNNTPIPTPEPRFEIPAPPPFLQPIPAPLDAEPNDLDEILRGGLAIVTEAIEFPARFPLQRSHDAVEEMLRLDAPERRPVPAPHAVMREPIARGLAREDRPTSAIPRPHLLTKPGLSSSRASQKVAATIDLESQSSERPGFAPRPVLAAGTPLERALSQLQGGPRS